MTKNSGQVLSLHCGSRFSGSKLDFGYKLCQYLCIIETLDLKRNSADLLVIGHLQAPPWSCADQPGICLKAARGTRAVAYFTLAAMRAALGNLLKSLKQLTAGQNTYLRQFSATTHLSSLSEGGVQPTASTSGRANPVEEDYRSIEARIFGNRLGNGQRSGAKVLRKKLLGDKIASYYPTPISKFDPMFVSLRAER